MTEIHDLRAQLREARASAPAPTNAAFKIPFGILAAIAVVLGFVVVLLTPKLYPVQRTAALPGFKEVRPREEPVAVAASLAARSDYAGKSADEAAKIADDVCAQRAAAAPQRGQAAVEAKLHCFLSEGAARFCSGSQARKATADIINYFKGIEYTNTAISVAAKMPAPLRAPLNDATTPAPAMLTPDPRVAEAIEGTSRGHRRKRSARLQGSLRAHRRYQGALPGAALVGGVEIAALGITRHFPSAVSISLSASSLAHSAGPASTPSSQPCASISSVVGMPNALPAVFRS